MFGAAALSLIPLLLIVFERQVLENQLLDRHHHQEEQPEPREEKCFGRRAYKEWIDSLFALAPPAPNCIDVEAFLSHYNKTSYAWVSGTIVLQRNTAGKRNNRIKIYSTMTTSQQDQYYHDAYEIMDFDTKKPAAGGRKGFFTKLWKDANRLRNLPPNLEMILYVNDKPRVHRELNRLPVFCITGLFPAGSGQPHQWLGYVPFPSHFYVINVPNNKKNGLTRTEFVQKRPVVYYRGTFSENAWSRYNRSNEYISTPRFKLANASKLESDRDVLDIQITDFAAVSGYAEKNHVRQDLRKQFNITMGQYVPSTLDGNAMMSLSVNGNGWAGATTMHGLLSNTAMLKVIDQTIDNEGYNRDMGEIYFPLLTPDIHYVSVESYNAIATTARGLVRSKDGIEKLFQISKAASKFARHYLGYECALDIVEVLAWRYYEYVKSGCDNAFAHVQIDK
jgi:hypothetical protein